MSTEAAGCATDDELERLRAVPGPWAESLRRLIIETDEALDHAAHITGDERDQVLADLTQERRRLGASLRRLTGEPDPADVDDEDDGDADDDLDTTGPILQASWMNGEVVLWAAGRHGPTGTTEELDELIAAAGAGAVTWHGRRPVALPDGRRAPAKGAAVVEALGWLVGAGAGQLAREAAPSVQWLGAVAVWATELVAQGRMAPTLEAARTGSSGGGGGGGGGADGGNDKGGTSGPRPFAVRWAPAVVERKRLDALAARMPGAVVAAGHAARPERICHSALAAMVDAICRAGAARLVAPATIAVARTRADVAEAVLAGLNGSTFTAAPGPAGDVASELARWAAPVTADSSIGLTVRLDPPEADGGWLLRVEVTGVGPNPLGVEHAIAAASRPHGRELALQLRRLERLLPPLHRPSARRGEVVVDAAEAWDIMTTTGATLAAAGFDVRVPAASARRLQPRLQLHAEAMGGPSLVGARQLSAVSWAAVVGDLELDAKAVADLAAQARPLVRVKGHWVELDKADLDAMAQALAERSKTTQLSGAEILRYAVGLEETAMGGPVLTSGSGWAVDLLQGVAAGPPAPLAAPEGFNGELRSYQADARGWLALLDRSGLGGCLAMDMGLGKTPTVLAHLLDNRGEGPVLVIAPPAVLGNWAMEAAKFTPGLSVHVHHGADRADEEALGEVTAKADLVLTTYATAARDVESLSTVEWRRVIVDEAQAIKNPASDTARLLRQIPAQSRLALTGTPVENGLGDLWSILDFTNPGLVGARRPFVEQLSRTEGASGAGAGKGGRGEGALRALNGILVFRRTKSEPEIAAELPDKIDELDQCGMTAEQVGLYQAVLDKLVAAQAEGDSNSRKGNVLAAITALKQICDHPAAYVDGDDRPLAGRSGKLARLDDLVEAVFAAGERMLIFTHFAQWGERMAEHVSERTGMPVACYHGGLTRTVRDRLVKEFQEGTGPGALVLSIKAGGSGLNLTAANHVVLYDRWWNPAVEDQARDRAWRIGQKNAVVCHRLVCPGTVDERVEEIVAGKRKIADLVLPASTSLADLDGDQLRMALGLDLSAVIEETPGDGGDGGDEEEAA